MLQSESVFLGDGSISGDSMLIVAHILWSLVSMFVVHCFLSLIVLQSSLWERESWTLYFVCLLVSFVSMIDYNR